MAVCAQHTYTTTNGDGSLTYQFDESSETLSVCGENTPDAYVLVPAAEYQTLAYSAFFDPNFLTLEQKQQIFSGTFSLPLIVYFVAWAYQVVIDFATQD